jgi:Kdo2-lipid IVA lauroyltransferase/acyltransferase
MTVHPIVKRKRHHAREKDSCYFLDTIELLQVEFSKMSNKRLLFRLGLFYLTLIGFVGHLLPRWFMFKMAVLVGNFYWAVMKKDREMVCRNLSQVLEGDREIKRTSRQTFINYAKYLVDYTRMNLLNAKNFSRLVRIFQGKEHIDQALSQGKGALILTAHLGNWEMGGVFLSLMDYPLNVITALDVEVRLHDYRVQLRQGQKIKVVTLDENLFSPISVLKALQANELVALLGDRELFGKGIPVTFFGQSIYFPMGPALLAYLSEAPLIPTFVLMENNKYYCLAEPPIVIQRTGNRDGDLAANSQKIAATLEKFIRTYPDQWYTFYDYFARHKAN